MYNQDLRRLVDEELLGTTDNALALFAAVSVALPQPLFLRESCEAVGEGAVTAADRNAEV